ncbi:hypothetical protein VP01_1659g1 [Puccinia sorghi]|uniref:Uncharacterized protein n=1 Tax=Puccinia sorghi TaxID=27349 RepID=A0A0L6VI67_9BASI|nr:hypothetical protein VP01_1659g1 [Puccinia sorghi]
MKLERGILDFIGFTNYDIIKISPENIPGELSNIQKVLLYLWSKGYTKTKSLLWLWDRGNGLIFQDGGRYKWNYAMRRMSVKRFVFQIPDFTCHLVIIDWSMIRSLLSSRTKLKLLLSFFGCVLFLQKNYLSYDTWFQPTIKGWIHEGSTRDALKTSYSIIQQAINPQIFLKKQILQPKQPQLHRTIKAGNHHLQAQSSHMAPQGDLVMIYVTHIRVNFTCSRSELVHILNSIFPYLALRCNRSEPEDHCLSKIDPNRHVFNPWSQRDLSHAPDPKSRQWEHIALRYKEAPFLPDAKEGEGSFGQFWTSGNGMDVDIQGIFNVRKKWTKIIR